MKRVYLTAGMGYGDEGKGSVTEALVRNHSSNLVVRYSGGAQAGHNVLLKDGRHHCFQQFGAGTFAGARTFLSRYMLVNPITLVSEAARLQAVGVSDAFAGLTVEDSALVTTPFHIAANRIREMTREGRHGSCGMGIGETMRDALNGGPTLRVGDLRDSTKVLDFLKHQRDYKRAEMLPLVEKANAAPDSGITKEWKLLTEDEYLDRARTGFSEFAKRVTMVDETWFKKEMAKDQVIVFEGAQGVLLDQSYGFQPYTTWTDTTFNNAMALLAGYDGEVKRVGITRAFQTRHGAGPMITENVNAYGLSAHDHNQTNEWQQNFRTGWLDIVTLRYAVEVLGGIDELVVTNLDRMMLATKPKLVASYLGPYDSAFFHDEAMEPRPDSPTQMVDVKRIKVERPTSHLHQSYLTLALKLCRPGRYIPGPRNERVFAGLIAGFLNNVPLTMLSKGPTYEDKVDLTAR